MKDVSGSFISSSGVGTQITIDVALPGAGEVGGGLDEPRRDHLGEFVGGDVGDVTPPRRDLGDLVRGDIDADDAVPGTGHFHDEGQTDVAQAHDAEHGAAITETLQKGHVRRTPNQSGVPTRASLRTNQGRRAVNLAILSQT